MEILVVFLLIALCFGLIFLISRWFLKNRYPKKTAEMLQSVPDLEKTGLKRTDQGYAGYFHNYYVTVYATTSLKRTGYMGGDNFQVWVMISPEPGQMKGLGGFFGKYMVVDGKQGFTMIGFVLKYDQDLNTGEVIQNKLQLLVDLLAEKGVKPFKVTGK
jgi:hypothetical protein